MTPDIIEQLDTIAGCGHSRLGNYFRRQERRYRRAENLAWRMSCPLCHGYGIATGFEVVGPVTFTRPDTGEQRRYQGGVAHVSRLCPNGCGDELDVGSECSGGHGL